MRLTGLRLAWMAGGVLILAGGCSRTDMQRVEDRTEKGMARIERNVDETRISAAVKGKLAADVRLSTLTSIDVDTSGKTVTLGGWVRSDNEKTWAEEVAKSVDGVGTVLNRIEVRRP